MYEFRMNPLGVQRDNRIKSEVLVAVCFIIDALRSFGLSFQFDNESPTTLALSDLLVSVFLHAGFALSPFVFAARASLSRAVRFRTLAEQLM